MVLAVMTTRIKCYRNVPPWLLLSWLPSAHAAAPNPFDGPAWIFLLLGISVVIWAFMLASHDTRKAVIVPAAVTAIIFLPLIAMYSGASVGNEVVFAAIVLGLIGPWVILFVTVISLIIALRRANRDE